MSKETLSRRDFLATALKTTLAAILGGIVKVVPEARPAVAAEPIKKTIRGFSAPLSQPDDQNYLDALALIKRSREYNKYKDKLSSPQPADYWTHSETGFRFASFVVQTEQFTDAHFRERPIQFLQTLVFAVDNHRVADVFLASVDPSTLVDYSNLQSTIKSLRTNSKKRIEHNTNVTATIGLISGEIRELKIAAQAASLKSAPADIPLPSQACAPYCDCANRMMYGCCGQTCGGGYVDDNCYWTCHLACVACRHPACIVACLAACRLACWVPPYCYCSCWYCRGCAC